MVGANGRLVDEIDELKKPEYFSTPFFEPIPAAVLCPISGPFFCGPVYH